MLGRLISMIAGRSIARTVGGVAAGPVGLVVGAALPTVLRRLGPFGMVAAAAGGYVVKKMIDRRPEGPTPRT